jgi:hypothetical protein
MNAVKERKETEKKTTRRINKPQSNQIERIPLPPCAI